MTTYLLVLCLLFLMAAAAHVSEKLQRPAYFIAMVCLFLFCATRLEVGCDWLGYLNQWRRQQGDGIAAALEKREPLWWLFIELSQRAGLPYTSLNVFSSLVFFVGIHAVARRQPDRVGFLALLFPILIMNMAMSGLRQAAAIGVICFALNAFVDRKPFRFIAAVVFATGFHVSSVVFILLAPMIGRYSRYRLVIAAALAVPAIYVLVSSSQADIAITRYVSSEVDAAGAIYRTGLLAISALVFWLYLRRPWRQAYPDDFSLAVVGSAGMVASFILVPVASVIADRLGYYFIVMQAILHARAPYLSDLPHRRLFVVAPYLVLAIVFVVWMMTSIEHFAGCYVPYRTWLIDS